MLLTIKKMIPINVIKPFLYFFFLFIYEPIRPVVYHHYRALMVGSVGVEGNDGSASPVRGPG